MKRFAFWLALLLCLTGCREAQPEAPERPENLAFTWQGITMTLDAPAEPVLTALGEPKTYTEEASCAFDGLDKTYYYGSFYLTTYPGKGGDRIAKIWFADDSVTTREGICVGATRAQVEAAYGVMPDGETACVVQRGNSRMTLILKDDLVGSIVYEVQ